MGFPGNEAGELERDEEHGEGEQGGTEGVDDASDRRDEALNGWGLAETRARGMAGGPERARRGLGEDRDGPEPGELAVQD